MLKGIVLCQGDKTTCGGKIIAGSAHGVAFNKPQAQEGDPVTCGKDGKTYKIIGGIAFYTSGSENKRIAGSLDSYSSCPCKAKFLPANSYPVYIKEEPSGLPPTDLAAAAALPAALLTQTKPEPAQHAQAAKKERRSDKREGIDAGFAVIPYGGTTEAWQRLLFTENPPAGAKELFATLNGAGERYKAGSIMLLVDPEKQDDAQIAHMKAAKARVDAALAPLSIKQANFLYKYKDTIEMFAAAATTANDVVGYSGKVTEAVKGYFEKVEKILIEIEKTYKNQYITNGTLIGEQFFIERRRLFGQLDSVLKMFMKHRFMFNEYTDLKSALGLSSRSITHRWNETGVSDIEGYATHIEKLAKYVKWMETAGKIGIGLAALDTAAKITEACTVGRDCAKTSFTSIGEFSGSLVGGSVGAKIISAGAANTVCALVLGAATIEAGGAGALLCTLSVSGGIAYGSDKAFGWMGKTGGNFIGEQLGLYEITNDD